MLIRNCAQSDLGRSRNVNEDSFLIDESEQHRGHAGWREGGETHFRVLMVAPDMAGKSRVERQRAVNRCLAEELAGGLHALAMDLRADDETR